ncbi:MAG: hypothetical protein V4713_03650 [Pseudomonadota bacterium]
MEDIGIIVALVAGIAAVFGKYRLAALLIGGLAFGPVIVHYAQTGGVSLGTETFFRLAICLICGWAAFKLQAQIDRPTNP